MTIRIIAIILCLLYLVYVLAETYLNNKRLKSFKHIIHVNGTRGKSSTCRLIDSGLRECGWKVFSKTTGTFPTMIDVEGNVIEIKRLGRANVREQLRMVNKAYKQNAEILVVECMAIQPELQYITQHKMLKADINIITNVRHDHLEEMGRSLDDIAKSLSNTIPVDGHIVVASDEFRDIFERQAILNNSTYHIAEDFKPHIKIDSFAENVNVAHMVGKIIGVDEKTYTVGMSKHVKDRGALKTYKLDDTTFINGLAINDPDSIKLIYKSITDEYNPDEITLLLNNRHDRPERVKQLLELIGELEYKNIIICGSYAKSFERQIKNKYNSDVKIIKHPEEILSEKVVFAIGNIAEKGFDILNYFEVNGRVING